MPWTWRYEDEAGRTVPGPAETFSSQADAESWLGQSWRDLTSAGVTSVALLDDERVEYRMSLLPAAD